MCCLDQTNEKNSLFHFFSSINSPIFKVDRQVEKVKQATQAGAVEDAHEHLLRFVGGGGETKKQCFFVFVETKTKRPQSTPPPTHTHTLTCVYLFGMLRSMSVVRGGSVKEGGGGSSEAATTAAAAATAAALVGAVPRGGA